MGYGLMSIAYVYVLKSLKNDSYYIGYASDLEKRLKQHNDGLVKATQYKRPYKLVYYESFEDIVWQLEERLTANYSELYSAKAEQLTITKARQREWAIKHKKSRKYIDWLIAGQSGV